MPCPDIRLVEDLPGHRAAVGRGRVYRVGLKTWFNRGGPVSWDTPWGLNDRARLEDPGTTLVTDLRIDRENLFPGRIPPDAVLLAEIEFIAEREMKENR